MKSINFIDSRLLLDIYFSHVMDGGSGDGSVVYLCEICMFLSFDQLKCGRLLELGGAGEVIEKERN